MNWKIAEKLLYRMVEAYNKGLLLQITYDTEVRPLMIRYKDSERSADLYNSIVKTEKILQNLDINTINSIFSEGYFMNERIKPSYSDILKVVGHKQIEWINLYNVLKDDFKLRINFRFYDATVGWVIEFRQSGKLKVVMAPDKDNFRIGLCFIDSNYPDITPIENFEDMYLQIHDYLNISLSK